MSGVVVLGAGHTGVRTALAARRAAFDGEITLVDLDRIFPPCERPLLSKWASDTVAAVPIFPPDQIEAAKLLCLTDRSIQIDKNARTIHLDSGANLSYQNLLLATGTRARPLEIKGAKPIATLRSKANADAIFAAATNAKSAIIIGAGFIGLELAASVVGKGLKVRVIEAALRILGRGTSPAIANPCRFVPWVWSNQYDKILQIAACRMLPKRWLNAATGLTITSHSGLANMDTLNLLWALHLAPRLPKTSGFP